MARAMVGTGLPYVVSVVIRGSGSLLDGTLLAEVIVRMAENPDLLAEVMVGLRDEFGLKVGGGCCGTESAQA